MEDERTSKASPLRRLLEPLGDEDFFSTYWQQRPCHIPRNDRTVFADILSLKNIEEILPLPERPSPALVYAINGRAPRTSPNAPDLYQTYRDGSTIKIDHVHRRFKPLNGLCRGLEACFHCSVGANVYLTPPASQGFRTHSDHEDVFVLQIDGDKQWEIWPPHAPLPLRNKDSPLLEDMPPAPLRILLRPGDFLYVPRGFPHRAYSETGASLHVTIGIHSLHWLDLVVAAARAAARRNMPLREALPHGFLQTGRLGPDDQERLRALFRLLADECDLSEAVSELGKALIRDQTPSMEGHFETLALVADMTGETRLRKHSGTIALIEAGISAVSLHFDRKTIRAPLKVLPALRFMEAAHEFSVADIPGLSPRAKLVLARRLVNEAWLTIV
jgi:ribosomal protein L16 Arg81 hydroxylase